MVESTWSLVIQCNSIWESLQSEESLAKQGMVPYMIFRKPCSSDCSVGGYICYASQVTHILSMNYYLLAHNNSCQLYCIDTYLYSQYKIKTELFEEMDCINLGGSDHKYKFSPRTKFGLRNCRGGLKTFGYSS